MPSDLFILFVVGPAGAAACLAACRDKPHLQRVSSLGTCVALWILSIAGLERVLNDGIVVLRMGNWQPPFGIVLVADVLSMTMVALTMTIAVAASIFAFSTTDRRHEQHFYYPLFLILIMGVNGAFLTGDLFNLFVFFEILLIASFALLALGSQASRLRETTKYLIINLIASTFFLIGLSVLYGTMGTLNMADLAYKIQSSSGELNATLTILSMVFLFVFGTKAAIFPLYFWLPGPYFQPSAALSAFFGGILTKVGVYAIFRTFTLIFVHDPSFTHELLLILAVATMLLGVFGALSQMDMKRILSYHIISQIGYLILGIGLFSPQALAGALFYMVPYVIAKSALFLTAGVIEEVTGTTDLKKVGGLQDHSTALSVLFLLAALSLAGIPPLAGFFSKLLLLQAGVEIGRYGYVAFGLLGGLLTLASMLKIWNGVFWGKKEGERLEVETKVLLPSVALLVLCLVVIGLFPGELYKVAEHAAGQISDPKVYIAAVLGPDMF